MRGSSGPESSSATLVGIRASIRCCSSFLSAARICSLRKENKNTSITATTAPRNVTMVINQIIWARTQTDDSAEPTAKTDIPSLISILVLISYGSAKKNSISDPKSRRFSRRTVPSPIPNCSAILAHEPDCGDLSLETVRVYRAGDRICAGSIPTKWMDVVTTKAPVFLSTTSQSRSVSLRS